VYGVPAGGVVTKPVLMYGGEADPRYGVQTSPAPPLFQSSPDGIVLTPAHKDPDVIAGIAAMLQEGLDRA
jgi:hypothetical protein